MSSLPESLRTSARIAAGVVVQPWVLVVAGGLAALPALWSAPAELGISTHDVHISAIYCDFAFLAALLGCILGLRELSRWEMFTSRWQPAEVLRHEAVVLALPTLLLAGLLLALGWAREGALAPADLAPFTLALARPVAAGLALRRLRLAPPHSALALLAACWWIPATLPPSFPLGLGLTPHLSLGAAASGASATRWSWMAELSLLLALLCAARLGLRRPTQCR